MNLLRIFYVFSALGLMSTLFAQEDPSLKEVIATHSKGEGTSGGRNTRGIQAATVLEVVKNSIITINESIYPKEKIEGLNKISPLVKVIMTGEKIKLEDGRSS